MACSVQHLADATDNADRPELAELQRAYEELPHERDTLASELQTRTAALAQRNTEYDERKSISPSPSMC